MPTTPPTITALPAAPDRADRATFSTRATAIFDALKNLFVGEANALASNVFGNATEAATSATTATTKAAEALASATSAATDAATATTKAGEASTSAGTASSAAATATTKAGEATSAAAAAAAAAASVGFQDVVFITSANSPYTVAQASSGKLIACDTSGGSIVVNLPTIAGLALPYVVGVKKTTSDANTVTINRGGADTFDDGTTSKSVNVPAGFTLLPDTDTSPDVWTAIGFGGANAGPATSSGLTMATAKILGRNTAGSGAIEEIPLATQAEMEAGTEANMRGMSPSRIAQAIAALGGGKPSIVRTYDPGRQWQATYARSASATGTYSQSGTAVTVTVTAHGLATGDYVYLDYTTGTAVDGWFPVTVTNANVFTVTAGGSLTTSGNVTLHKPITVTLSGVPAGMTPSLSDGLTVGIRFTSGGFSGSPASNVAATVRKISGSSFQIVGLKATVATTSGNCYLGGFGATVTWTKPAGLVSVDVIVAGSGAQGQGCTISSTEGRGGHGAAVAIKNIPASALGATELITLGLAGATAEAAAAPQLGGSSSFGAHCSAGGGVVYSSGTPAVAVGGDVCISGQFAPYSVRDNGAIGHGAGSYFGSPTLGDSPSASYDGKPATTIGGGGTAGSDPGSSGSRCGGFGGMGIVIIRENY